MNAAPHARISALRLKIGSKVYLVFGGVLALCLAILLVLYASFKAVDAQLERIVEVHAPLRVTTFEMEINTVGVGLGVMKYLEKPDPKYRHRVEKDAADFTRFKAEYDRLSRDDLSLMGRKVETDYQSFVALGKALMNRQDELEAQLVGLGEVMRKADALVDREIDGGNADPRLIGLAVEFAETGQWLGLYLHTRNPVYLDNLDRDRTELRRRLAAGRGAGSGAGVAEVRRLVNQVLSQVDGIVGLWQARDQDVQRFIELRQRLDQQLDEGVQKRVERDSLAAKGEARAAARRVVAMAVGAILLLLTASLAAAWMLARQFILPLRKLADGVATVTAGRLDCQIEHDTGDEFGELARGFNHMASQLHEERDLLERRIEERTRELAHQAHHDALTGLVNRVGLVQRLDDAVKAARRRGEKLGVLLLDLDGFKAINDSRGHHVGDLLLQEVGRRLQGQVRDVDVAARLGGDEFCLLLTDVGNHSRAAEVAERCLAALSAPIQLDGGMAVSARGSFGIAIFPEDGEDSGDLLKAADTAMYAAKHAGKQRYAFYEAHMTQEVMRQMAMESALRAAFAQGEFELHYQPQIGLEDGRMRGVEALIRWRHPERGLVPPDEFIPMVEHIGLMGALGEWVLRTACRQAMVWQEGGLEGLTMAVNISSSHYESSGFVDAVALVLRDTGLAPSSLEIEITESVTRNPRLHAAISGRLRELGASVSIDDFGTGYSSLAILKDLPIDILKLDKQFIQDMLVDAKSSVLIGALIGMARGLGFATVAEGVETLEQVQVLKGLGCQFIQGYFFSRPVTADRIPSLAGRDFLKDMTAQPAAESVLPLGAVRA